MMNKLILIIFVCWNLRDLRDLFRFIFSFLRVRAFLKKSYKKNYLMNLSSINGTYCELRYMVPQL